MSFEINTSDKSGAWVQIPPRQPLRAVASEIAFVRARYFSRIRVTDYSVCPAVETTSRTVHPVREQRNDGPRWVETRGARGGTSRASSSDQMSRPSLRAAVATVNSQ